jgi:hypothetical protein
MIPYIVYEQGRCVLTITIQADGQTRDASIGIFNSVMTRTASGATRQTRRAGRAALTIAASLVAASGWAQPPEPPPPGVGPNGPVSAAQFPDVGLIAPPAPTAQELAPDGLFHFIVHHGSTHYSAAAGAVGGSLLRWRGGRSETICPGATGLDPGYNDFVAARVRAIAAFVGAPVRTDDPKCLPNVEIIFTQEPRGVMAAVQQWAARSLHVRFDHQMEKALDISDEHAIQGWYATAGGGASVLNRDPGLIGGIALEALWPRVIPTSVHANGASRSILGVVLVIDSKKVAGITIGSIADYAALVGLTVIQNPDQCDPLPSILDIESPACAARDKPAGITAGDLAFLKALYYMNTGIGGTLSRDSIQANMMKQFRGG